MTAVVWIARTADEIARCFPVMRELRPHLADNAEFIERIQRQQAAGYRLAALDSDGEIRAVAGFRITDSLAWGRFLYVDDFVTREVDRCRGHGNSLFEWLIAEARRERCAELHLDSGVQRFEAHRFYLDHRMAITSHHFALSL